ncbi:MAG: hypothetical protein ABR517_09520 [Thermoanaerobaculia bacterium]
MSNREGGLGMGDFYISYRSNPHDDLGWGPPQRIAEISSASDEFGPWGFEHPESGALVLFFTSDRPGGSGGSDIYTSTQQDDGTFSTPMLVAEVSTAAGEVFPVVRGDGLEMFLTSNRPGGMGGNDIWVSNRGSIDDPWSTPVNVGMKVNSPDAEQRSSITADGLEMVFFSSRPGGAGNVDMYETTRRRASLIPVAGSVTGPFGMSFRTWARLTNPSGETATGSIVFRPAETQPSLSDPRLTYTLAPFESRTFANLVAELGVSGVGSLEIHPETGAKPAVSVRIDNGQSVVVPEAGEENVLVRGTAGAISVPDLTRSRLNIGVRTLQAGVTMTVHLTDAAGNILRSQDHSFPPDYFVQMPATAMVGGALTDGEAITILVQSGSAVVYGSAPSNVGGSSTLHLVTRSDIE